MVDNRLYYTFAIVLFLYHIVAYLLFIRNIIWSIARCDIGDTALKSMEIKKNKNFSMSYLSNYITVHKKQYIFWMKIKRLYAIAELIIFLIYLILPMTNCILRWPFIIYVTQSFILIFIIFFQFDLDRETKYDRIRKGKSKK